MLLCMLIVYMKIIFCGILTALGYIVTIVVFVDWSFLYFLDNSLE